MEDDFKIAKNFLSEKEFDIYRKREMKNLVSDFDKAIEKIKKIKNKN